MTSETFVFLPWLRLKEPVELYDLVFCPIGQQIGFANLPDYAINQAQLIASSYTDRAGHKIPDFTIVLNKDESKPHNLTTEEFSSAKEAASLLFFCSWSLNDYYCGLGDYSNSSMFNLVGQRFSLSDPNGIALTLRRRDGETLCGGFNHGQVRFVCPSQYAINHQVNVDTQLLTSLLNAKSQGSSIFDLLTSVMGLLELANTDNDYMSHPSEIILMGSALETFLEIEGNQKAFKLGQAFSDLFSSCSSRTAQDALDNGRTVFIDQKGAQPTWSILQTWSHEFYQLRNEHAHAKETPNRTWGWYDLEHLIFAAFSFPLMVKAKLAKNGLYTLSKRDKQKCFALGELLITTGWGEPPHEFNNNWRNTISDASWSSIKDDLLAHFKEE